MTWDFRLPQPVSQAIAYHITSFGSVKCMGHARGCQTAGHGVIDVYRVVSTTQGTIPRVRRVSSSMRHGWHSGLALATCLVPRLLFRTLPMGFFPLVPRVGECSCGRFGNLRPHESLGGKTPAEACGAKVEGKDKWLTLIQNASRQRNGASNL